jgi:hypothetical protein
MRTGFELLARVDGARVNDVIELKMPLVKAVMARELYRPAAILLQKFCCIDRASLRLSCNNFSTHRLISFRLVGRV